MNKKLDNIDELFFDTNKQKVLKFLAQNPSQSLMASEIIKNTNISKAGANIALRELVKVDLIKRSIKGKTHLYQVDFHNPLVKQFKVIEAVVELYPLIKKLNGLSQQIILFGSASRGENLEDKAFPRENLFIFPFFLQSSNLVLLFISLPKNYSSLYLLIKSRIFPFQFSKT